MPLPRMALLCLVACSACALPVNHPYELAEGVDPASIESVYLAPINATTRLEDDLLSSSERVKEQILKHLEANGCRVVEVPLYRFRHVWSKSFRGVDLKAADTRRPDGLLPPPPAEAMAKLFRSLGSSEQVDALLVPDLVVRPARLNGHMARWDGVSRRQESSDSRPWTGHTNALSLRLRMFGPDGELLFEGLGGLDLLFKINVRKVRAEVADEILSNPGHVVEGVSIAFDPFYPFAR